MRQGNHIQDCIPLPVRQSSCYSLFKRHSCKVSLSTITLRVEEGAVAGTALCQAHVGVIGIEEILTALVNIDHQLGAFGWGSILTQAAKKFDVAFHDIKLFIHMKAALGYEYGCAGLRIWLHQGSMRHLFIVFWCLSMDNIT